METFLHHLQLNVRAANLGFYRDLMAFLGWHTIMDADGFLGVFCADRASLWFVGSAKEVVNDYDGPGTNHVAIGTPSQDEVDATCAYLAEHKIAALFETPRHRPEFSQSPDNTYYQVMFESPDRILFEVVYTGPKSI